MSASQTSAKFAEDRRVGAKDRRTTTFDRRNEDRVAEEVVPRRNPDIPDRRKNTE